MELSNSQSIGTMNDFLRVNFSSYLTSHNIIEFLFLSLYSIRDHALKSALIYHISFCSCLTKKTPLRVIVISMHILFPTPSL